MPECEQCGAPDAPLRALTDPWRRVYEREHLCDACWEREPEPDLNAVSAGERYAMAWEEKRRLKEGR